MLTYGLFDLSRIEELTNQLRTIEKEITSNQGTQAAAEVSRNLQVHSPDPSHSARSQSRTSDHSISKGHSISPIGASPDNLTWCDLDPFDRQDSTLSWTIGEISLERAIVVNLFRQ